MERYNDEIKLKDILITLSEYKLYIWEKKVVIMSFSFFFFLLAVSFSFTKDTQYKAELTFVVEGTANGAKNSGGVLGIASQFGFDISSGSSSTFSQDNILELFKSRGVIESALMQKARVNGKNDLLIEHYIEINKIRESWVGDEDGESVSFHADLSITHDSISGVIWGQIIDSELTVKLQSDESDIINLSYTSLDDEFSKEFAITLVQEMIKMYTTHQTAQANNTLDFLRNRADSVFLELEDSEKDLARIQDINARIVKASGRLKELQVMRQVEVLNTMYLEIVKNLELSKITLLNQTPIIKIIDTPRLPLEEDNPSKRILGLIGGFLAGFLSICYFILRKLFKDSLAEES